MLANARAAIALAAVALLAAPLAGCATAEDAPRVANFDLTPARLGWNVGEEAQFTLTLKPALIGGTPANYTVDRDFAIAELALKKRGGVGGSYETKNSADVSLRLWRGGSQVAEAALGPGNDSVNVTLNLPDSLHDAEYTLELHLFKVGWVSSDRFRVNVP